MRLRLLAFTTLISGLLNCGGVSSKEASTELDLQKLVPLLAKVQSLLDSGLGSAQISQIDQDFRGLAMNGSKSFALPVVYRGENVTLRVQIRKEDVDTVELRFFGPPALAEQIQQTMVKNL